MTNQIRDKHNVFLRDLWAMNHLNVDLQAKVATILDEDASEVDRLNKKLSAAAYLLYGAPGEPVSTDEREIPHCPTCDCDVT